MKILILIIASNQPEHELDLQSQKNTWVETCNDNVSVIFLRGWDEQKYQFDNGVLFVPIQETYSNILNKTILGLKYILNNIDFDVLVRSNVSTYFETNKLFKELSSPKYQGSFVGGYFDKSKDINFYPKDSFEYISGTGIYLSKDAVHGLSNLDSNNYTGVSEDLAIFDYLKNSGFKIIRMTRNNLFSTHFFIPTYNIRLKNSFNSQSASRRMQLVHNFFNTKNLLLKTLAYFEIQINEIREFLSHPEHPYLYAVKNRVVLNSFFKMKINRFKLTLFRNSR
jgi:hypothetical protein